MKDGEKFSPKEIKESSISRGVELSLGLDQKQLKQKKIIDSDPNLKWELDENQHKIYLKECVSSIENIGDERIQQSFLEQINTTFISGISPVLGTYLNGVGLPDFNSYLGVDSERKDFERVNTILDMYNSYLFFVTQKEGNDDVSKKIQEKIRLRLEECIRQSMTSVYPNMNVDFHFREMRSKANRKAIDAVWFNQDDMDFDSAKQRNSLEDQRKLKYVEKQIKEEESSRNKKQTLEVQANILARVARKPIDFYRYEVRRGIGCDEEKYLSLTFPSQPVTMPKSVWDEIERNKKYKGNEEIFALNLNRSEEDIFQITRIKEIPKSDAAGSTVGVGTFETLEDPNEISSIMVHTHPSYYLSFSDDIFREVSFQNKIDRNTKRPITATISVGDWASAASLADDLYKNEELTPKQRNRGTIVGVVGNDEKGNRFMRLYQAVIHEKSNPYIDPNANVQTYLIFDGNIPSEVKVEFRLIPAVILTDENGNPVETKLIHRAGEIKTEKIN